LVLLLRSNVFLRHMLQKPVERANTKELHVESPEQLLVHVASVLPPPLP
jgi:hypothetical protein